MRQHSAEQTIEYRLREVSGVGSRNELLKVTPAYAKRDKQAAEICFFSLKNAKHLNICFFTINSNIVAPVPLEKMQKWQCKCNDTNSCQYGLQNAGGELEIA